MQLSHMTPQDDSLTHQVRFMVKKRSSEIHMSCNCKQRAHPTGVAYDSMGRVDGNIELARKIYNDPANHNKPFTEEDIAKW